MFGRVNVVAWCVLGTLGQVGYGWAGERPAAHGLRPEEAADGWLQLFDGQTLFGWNAFPQHAWQVRQGILHVNLQRTTPAGKPPMAGSSAKLISTTQWADFVLRMDFRADPGTQASLWLRTDPSLETAPETTSSGPEGPPEGSKASRKNTTGQGYEMVLVSEDPAIWPTGSLKGRQKAATGVLEAGWHTMEAHLDGGTITLCLDGQQVLRWEDPKPIRRGHLVLEVQGGSAAFRNIKLRPLGLQSIFNGKDLSGWKLYPQTPTKATVTPEGYLRVQGGRGPVESEGQYADFTLQLDVFVNGQGLNSGVFFRCIPGEIMNGYECQIQNGFLDGDRRKPKDCGTGGIFRRQNARRVVADDFQWFTLTIHAHGPHIATWVNGYPTADWTDTRPPHPNPRRGRRLEPGTLQIQGHDPTTDLMFRNIRVAELPDR